MAYSLNTRPALVLAIAGTLVSGCATKDFGRLEGPSVAAMSCEQLAYEQKRVDDFRAAIDRKDDFDVRSATAALIDFGYGNHRDKKKALASAERREAEVAAARRAHGCA